MDAAKRITLPSNPRRVLENESGIRGGFVCFSEEHSCECGLWRLFETERGFLSAQPLSDALSAAASNTKSSVSADNGMCDIFSLWHITP